LDFTPYFREVASYDPVDLIVGTFPVRRGTVTIESGQVLKAGSVLGRKTASGKYVLCAAKAEDESAIADGSEKPVRILSSNVDASAGDRVATVYITGAFLKSGIQVGKGHTVESVTDDLELRSIYLEEPSH
jgi:hypothetical protein